MVYHVTWTTHEGDSHNPARQVTEEFNTVSAMGGISYRAVEQKVHWLIQSGIPYVITPKDNNLAV
jgi:hypothetical protein